MDALIQSLDTLILDNEDERSDAHLSLTNSQHTWVEERLNHGSRRLLSQRRYVVVYIPAHCKVTIGRLLQTSLSPSTIFEMFPTKISERTEGRPAQPEDSVTMGSSHEMKSPDVQNDEQRMWWDNNGKTFRLLDLPPELRETVYLHTIGCIIAPDLRTDRSTGKIKVYLGLGLSTEPKTRAGRYRDPDIQRPNVSILQLNKQIRQEAMEVAYRDTIKRISTLGKDVNHLMMDLSPRLLSLPFLL